MKEKLVRLTVVAMPDAPTVATMSQHHRAHRVFNPDESTAAIADAKKVLAVPEKQPRPMKVRTLRTPRRDPEFDFDAPTSKRPLWHLAVHRSNPPLSTGHYFSSQRDAFWALFSLVAWVPGSVGLTIAIDPVRGGNRFVAERRLGVWSRTE